MQMNRPLPQNRAMIKYDAREALRGRMLAAFGACLLAMALAWVMQLIPTDALAFHLRVMSTETYAIDFAFSLVTVAVSTVVAIFAQNPMGVCLSRFFLSLHRDRENRPSVLSVCDCFGPGYGRLAWATFLRDVRVWLWAVAPLLVGAVIPGGLTFFYEEGILIVAIGDFYAWFAVAASVLWTYRGLVYAMLPYVLADNPRMTAGEALSASREITRGRVWELFVLQLSFFGWLLLVSFTLFIGAIYVYPYIESTMAGYYIAFTKGPDSEADLRAA